MQPFPFGPICGSNHDAFMLRESGLIRIMHYIAFLLGRVHALYGDLAYPNDPSMQRPFGPAADPGSWQWMLDDVMTGIRICVEWGFGKIVNLWGFLDHATNLKILLQQVGLYYPVANILTNCHTCLYGSQTGSYFHMMAPQLEDYLSGAPLEYKSRDARPSVRP
jgi:hypothetical protein